MGKKISEVKFELHKVYKSFTDQLFQTGDVADFMLGSANISSAGNQVESSVRILLSNLLPSKVAVSQGHIVDKNAQISYQQDILVTDSSNNRSLFKTLDGTEFFPFECVFATGEVKKKWSNATFKSTVNSIKRSKSVLQRFPIPNDVIETGSTFIRTANPIAAAPHRNPLFCFAFALAFDSRFRDKEVNKLMHQRGNWKTLPNITVVLDTGVYILVDIDDLEKGNLTVKMYPEYVLPEDNCQWCLLRLAPEESLAYLVFMLNQHINDTILEKASLLTYSQSMLDISLTNITLITET